MTSWPRTCSAVTPARFALGLLAAVGMVPFLACSRFDWKNEARSSDDDEDLRVVIDRAVPLDDGEIRFAGVALRGEERAALEVRARQAVKVQSVVVPYRGRLLLGVGVLDRRTNDPAGSGVEFTVSVGAGAGLEEVWKRPLDPAHRAGDAGWKDVEIPLESWEGKAVDLILETRPLNGGKWDRAGWSDLILVGKSAERGLSPIRRSIQLRELSNEEGTLLQVPRASALVVAGMVVRKRGVPSELDPVTFRVSVDGREIWKHDQPTRQLRNGFHASVPMDRWAGRNVRIQLETDMPGSGAEYLEIRWSDASLVTREALSRESIEGGPNILVLVVDTLRADHLSAYGYGRTTSPVLDGLGRKGVLFTNAISQSSWTMPATASLLTGLYPHEHRVTDGQPLAARHETFAELAQAEGLTTLAISANPLIGASEGFSQGYERFVHVPWARAEGVNRLLLQFLREYAGSRWLAYVHYIDPHDPYNAPEPYASQFKGRIRQSRYANHSDFAQLTDAVNFKRGVAVWGNDDLEYLKAAYDSEIRYWDAELGAVLARLNALEALENTIVIVTSDHGEEFLEHGRLKHGIHLYQESIRVPLIIVGPGVRPRVHELPIETRGLFTLIRTLLRARTRRDFFDPRELLRTPRSLVYTHTDHGLLAHEPTRTELAAISDGRWKLIHYPASAKTELYDLLVDPGETRDVRRGNSAVTGRLLEQLVAWRKDETESNPPERDPRILEELRALGYVQ